MPCWEYPPAITGGLGVACGGLGEVLSELVDLTVVTPSELGGGAYEAGYEGDLKERVHGFTERVVEGCPEVDLVHAHDWMSFPAAMDLQSRRGTPFIAHVHSFEWDRVGENEVPWIAGIEHEGLKRADRVVVVSNYTARMAVDRCGVDPAKIRVVHNGVPPVDAWRSNSSGEWVVFLGRLTSQKAPDVFVEMAEQVMAERPRCHFVVAGEGEMLEVLKHRARDLGLEDRIEFAGFLSRPAVRALLARADVVCMPSRSEPFGLVALEAAQFGVPTVLSTHAGVSEVLRSNPVVRVGDVDGFARQVVALLDDDEGRQQAGERLRLEAAEASWTIAAAKVLEIYRELVDGRNASR